jgi:hypothetical protein
MQDSTVPYDDHSLLSIVLSFDAKYECVLSSFQMHRCQSQGSERLIAVVRYLGITTEIQHIPSRRYYHHIKSVEQASTRDIQLL